MKILFMLHIPIPYPGAAWARIEHFASFFARSDREVHIAGSFSLRSLDRFGIIYHGETKIFNFTAVIGLENIFSIIFNSITSFLTSVVLIGYLRPDVVIISIPDGQTAIGSFAAAKIVCRRKVIIDYRDEWEDFAIVRSANPINKKSFLLLKKLITYCYRKSDLVVTVTESLSRKLSERKIVNLKLVPNGADTTIFFPKPRDQKIRSKLGCKESDFIILYSGHIGGYYRLDSVISALGKVTPHLGIKLVMIGMGPDIDKVMALAKNLGLTESVLHIWPTNNKTELSYIISASNLGIIPYDANPLWKDSLPSKVFEYLACGLPVVATVFEDSELAKMLTLNKIGIISEPEKPDMLASQIELVASNKLLYGELSRNAAVVIKNQYDRNVIARKFLNLVESC
jgi:glycosyltransferase involved in cell wall biosynthesis